MFKEAIAQMDEREIKQRIKATNSKAFKAALEAALKGSDSVIEGELSTTAEVVSETLKEQLQEAVEVLEEEGVELEANEPVLEEVKPKATRKRATKNQ